MNSLKRMDEISIDLKPMNDEKTLHSVITRSYWHNHLACHNHLVGDNLVFLLSFLPFICPFIRVTRSEV